MRETVSPDIQSLAAKQGPLRRGIGKNSAKLCDKNLVFNRKGAQSIFKMLNFEWLRYAIYLMTGEPAKGRKEKFFEQKLSDGGNAKIEKYLLIHQLHLVWNSVKYTKGN